MAWITYYVNTLADHNKTGWLLPILASELHVCTLFITVDFFPLTPPHILRVVAFGRARAFNLRSRNARSSMELSSLVCTHLHLELSQSPAKKRLIVLPYDQRSAMVRTHSSFLSKHAAQAIQKVVARKWLARLL